MKKGNRLVVLATIIAASALPLAAMAGQAAGPMPAFGPVEMIGPIPLQNLDRDGKPTTISYARAIESVLHPLRAGIWKNFKLSDRHQIQIEGEKYDVADFVLTPGNILKAPAKFYLDEAKIDGQGLDAFSFLSGRLVYIADVRDAMKGESPFVPPTIFTDDYLEPYAKPYPNFPTMTPAYSLAKIPGSEDIVAVTYSPVGLTQVPPEGEPRRITYASPAFYMKRIIGGDNDGLYRVAGILAIDDRKYDKTLRNSLAIDIESPDINGDGRQDIAVLNRDLEDVKDAPENRRAYVLFLTKRDVGNDDWENAQDAFNWPSRDEREFYLAGRDPFDAAVISDKVDGKWRDALIVPSFDKIEGRYIAYKIFNDGRGMITQEIDLGVPGFVAENCRQEVNEFGDPPERCGAVQMECTRFETDRPINDLNNDGCGDCVVTWGNLIEREGQEPRFILFDSFTVHVSEVKDGRCEDRFEDRTYRMSAILPKVYFDPASEAESAVPTAKAYAIEITDADKDGDLDVWIGDYAVYSYKDELDVKKYDTLVYLFRSNFDEDGDWALLERPDLVKAYKANYSDAYMDKENHNYGGVIALAADQFENLGVINGYPFIPPSQWRMCTIRRDKCPGNALVIFDDLDNELIPAMRDLDGDCVPDCVYDDDEGVWKRCDDVANPICPPDDQGVNLKKGAFEQLVSFFAGLLISTANAQEQGNINVEGATIKLPSQEYLVTPPGNLGVTKEEDTVIAVPSVEELDYEVVGVGVGDIQMVVKVEPKSEATILINKGKPVPPPPPPPTTACGNGKLEDGEKCDDGNVADGDGCSSKCLSEKVPPPTAKCGNGELDDGEKCDDGNVVDGDGCSGKCLLEGGLPLSKTCSFDVDRPYMINGQLYDPIEDNEYKPFRLEVRRWNDEYRRMTGLQTDIFVPEYVGTYIAKTYLPVAEVSAVGENNIIAPVIQTSGMKANINWQAERKRGSYRTDSAQPGSPLVILPTEKMMADNRIPRIGLPAFSIVPDEEVSIRGRSEYSINGDVFGVKYELVEDAIVKDIGGANEKIVSPLKVSVRGVGGLDGCYWSTCADQMPPDHIRGLDPEAILRATQMAVDERKLAGKAITPSIFREILEKERWDSTGYLEMKFSLTPELGQGLAPAMKSELILDKAAAVGGLRDADDLFTPEEARVVAANIAGFPDGCDELNHLVALTSSEVKGGCNCNMSGSGPSPSDWLAFTLFSAFIGLLASYRRRVSH